jgi:plastocyanin
MDANHSELEERKVHVFEANLPVKRAFEALAVMLAAAAVAMGAAGPAAAEKRFVTVLAVEPKGGTTVDKEPYPTELLPAGGGFVMVPLDEKTRRWEVSAYVWQPSQIIVEEGDEVTLEFGGINGAAHPSTSSGYGHTFTVKRGHAHRMTFTADKAGVFRLTCATHKPSMSAELIVLKKNRPRAAHWERLEPRPRSASRHLRMP